MAQKLMPIYKIFPSSLCVSTENDRIIILKKEADLVKVENRTWSTNDFNSKKISAACILIREWCAILVLNSSCVSNIWYTFLRKLKYTSTWVISKTQEEQSYFWLGGYCRITSTTQVIHSKTRPTIVYENGLYIIARSKHVPTASSSGNTSIVQSTHYAFSGVGVRGAKGVQRERLHTFMKNWAKCPSTIWDPSYYMWVHSFV